MVGFGKEWKRYWRNSSNGFFKAFHRLLEDNGKWFLYIKGFEDGVRNFQDKLHSILDLGSNLMIVKSFHLKLFGLEGFPLLMWRQS
jgi:hypothetical protein